MCWSPTLSFLVLVLVALAALLPTPNLVQMPVRPVPSSVALPCVSPSQTTDLSFCPRKLWLPAQIFNFANSLADHRNALILCSAELQKCWKRNSVIVVRINMNADLLAEFP